MRRAAATFALTLLLLALPAAAQYGPGPAPGPPVGTSGATVPLNNGGFTQSDTANFIGPFEINGLAITFPPSGAPAGITDTETLTNKTLTSPVINGGTITGASLSGYTFTDPTVTGGTFTGGAWSGGTIDGATITNGSLSGYSFANPTFTGTVSGNGTIPSAVLVNTGVTAASYGTSTSIPSFTVNAQGQITAAAGNAVVAPAGTLIGTGLASNVVSSSLISLAGGAVGTAAFAATGTSGATVPLNSGGFTQSGAVNFTGPFQIGGTVVTYPGSGLLVGTTDTQSLTNKSIAGSEINSGVVGATYGGTGINNGSSTLTLGGSLTTTGAATPTLAFGTGSNTYTYPAASDTLAGIAATQTLTNKSIAGSEINSGLVGATYGGTGVNNGSKTITLGGSITTTGAATPTLAFGTGSNTYTYPAATDTLAALGTIETFSAAQTISATGVGLSLTGTGAMLVNKGTTGQEPDTGNAGEFRYNTTTGRYEFGVGGSWLNHVQLTGDTMTGALTAPGFLNQGSIVLTGTLPDSTKAPIYFSNNLSGWHSGGGSGLNYINLQTDTMNGELAAFYLLHVRDVIAAGASGSRVAIEGQVNVNALTTNTGKQNTAFIGVDGMAVAAAASPADGAQGWPQRYTDAGTSVPGNYLQGLWGGHVSTQVSSAAVGWNSFYGLEVDDVIDPAAIYGEKVGVKIVDQSTAPSFGNHNNSALAFDGVPSWTTLINIAGANWPLASTGTIMGISQPYLVTGETALYGIDLRNVATTSGGGSFAAQFFQVGYRGDTYANSYTTKSSIQAQTATLTGVTIVDGGAYLTIPTWTVSAPVSGGSAATVTTATMAGREIVAFGSTGGGYLNTDTGLTLVGGVGTSPTLAVATVDAHGGVTSWTITSPGSWTRQPDNPIQVSGGSGTGAWVNLKYTVASGVWTPIEVDPAATGLGFHVNDVLVIVGDTGTATQFTVGAVNGTGGIQPANLAVSTPGSITAIGGTVIGGVNYHTFTGGAGTGGLLQVAYAVASVTTTPGSGYTPLPLPVINSGPNSTDYIFASLIAQMTPAAAVLALNPSGGGMSINGTAGVSCPSGVTAGTVVVINGLVTHC